MLASASWDKTVRLSNLYAKDQKIEIFDHNSEITVLAFRPDGKEICTATLKGELYLWDVENGYIKLKYTVDLNQLYLDKLEDFLIAEETSLEVEEKTIKEPRKIQLQTSISPQLHTLLTEIIYWQEETGKSAFLSHKEIFICKFLANMSVCTT